MCNLVMLSSLIEFPPSSIFCSSQIDDLQYRVRERLPSFIFADSSDISFPGQKTRRPKLIAPDHFSTREDTPFAPPLPLLLHPLLQHNIKTRGRGGKRKGGVGRRRNSPICSVGFVAQTLTFTFPFLYVGILLTLATFFWANPAALSERKSLPPPLLPPRPATRE